MHTATRSAVLLVLLTFVMGAAPARAETVHCTPITELPAVITAQGVYIEIATNNVVLDLNGFKLGGLAAGLGTHAYGIYALDRQNITIKNGTIRGFLRGIILDDTGASQGHVVEDIRADRNTLFGIEVRGSSTIVRNNQVVATGGSTTVIFVGVRAAAIFVGGNGPRVLNNDVITTAGSVRGPATGILLAGVIGGLVVNNRITEADRGIQYFGGSTGKYRDNQTSNVTTPFDSGTDAGNNN